MNSKHLRRLARDHSLLHKQGLPPNYLWPPSSSSYTTSQTDDLTTLDVLLLGPEGTPYASGLFHLHLSIPPTYPTAPPTASFKTKIWHPNVDEATGAICVDTLKRDWKSCLGLRDVLVVVGCLLVQPNAASALNGEAGRMVEGDWGAFERRVRLLVGMHAAAPAGMREAVAEARGKGKEVVMPAPAPVEREDSVLEVPRDAMKNKSAEQGLNSLTNVNSRSRGKRKLARVHSFEEGADAENAKTPKSPTKVRKKETNEPTTPSRPFVASSAKLADPFVTPTGDGLGIIASATEPQAPFLPVTPNNSKSNASDDSSGRQDITHQNFCKGRTLLSPLDDLLDRKKDSFDFVCNNNDNPQDETTALRGNQRGIRQAAQIHQTPSYFNWHIGLEETATEKKKREAFQARKRQK
ncbi:hypothetical protein LTS18_008814 [Coniosporium uncinatum]|uniref:Uncharacterized protein n=1 Tax=Coniosporium uncinatum TaxID=93489 RepID=A0ACC3DWP9_9PEZI|nr:hypothetical protein LTS18_008814 [Coniosporium uncinatum]